MIKQVSSWLLRLMGWKAVNNIHMPDKCVLIGVPHTSNWDFIVTILGISSLGIRFNWVAKHTLFRFPFGWFFRAIGGIPVNRKSSTSFLKGSINLYKVREKLVLAIAPEGTRSKTKYWKSGFYILAQKSRVPVVYGYIDYPSKEIGIGGILHPSGNLEDDMKILKVFYQGKHGKILHNQGPVEIKRGK